MPMAINYLQQVAAMSASETASSAQEVGTNGVERAGKQRKELQTEIRRREEEASKLQEELDDALDTNFLEDVGNWLTGGDSGAGEIGDKMARNATEMERASKELMIAQTKIEAMLAELQTAQRELNSRTNDREKAYDETERAGAVAKS